MRGTFRYLTLATGLFLAAATSFAQNVRINVPLVITNRLGDSFTLHFGVDDRATYCADPELGELPMEWPCGDTPEILWLCAVLEDPRGYNPLCFDQGMLLDLRGYYSRVQLDTFELATEDVATSYPLTIRWPATLNQLFDSARMVDAYGGVYYDVNMLSTDSLVISAHPPVALRIFTVGPKRTVGIVGKIDVPHARFSLSQNFPNPFNPSTKIQYSIDKAQHITLTVYDIFGRVIAKLVDERRPPGDYELTWNASSFASGVYFCRLLGERSIRTTKMLLVR